MPDPTAPVTSTARGVARARRPMARQLGLAADERRRGGEPEAAKSGSETGLVVARDVRMRVTPEGCGAGRTLLQSQPASAIAGNPGCVAAVNAIGDLDVVVRRQGDRCPRRYSHCGDDSPGSKNRRDRPARAAREPRIDHPVFGRRCLGPTRSARRSRSLKRRTLPCGPLGSSETNSIQRGYLYGASSRFTYAMRSCSRSAPAVVADVRHHEGQRFRQAVVVLDADDRALPHRLVGQQRALDLARRHPLAADLEQIVGAAAVEVGAVVVDEEAVAGCGASRRGTPPRSPRGSSSRGQRRAAQLQRANLARRPACRRSSTMRASKPGTGPTRRTPGRRRPGRRSRSGTPRSGRSRQHLDAERSRMRPGQHSRRHRPRRRHARAQRRGARSRPRRGRARSWPTATASRTDVGRSPCEHVEHRARLRLLRQEHRLRAGGQREHERRCPARRRSPAATAEHAIVLADARRCRR